jgi:hypothetical protein
MFPIALSVASSVCAVPAAVMLATFRRARVTLRPLNAPIVLPANQMVRLVKRECARIDRNGLTCALAVFNLPEGRGRLVNAEIVVAAMRERARLTDVVGWLDEKTLCAFLTDSTLDGAKAFADSVRDELKERIPSLAASIHNYDGKWAAVDGDAETPAEPVPALAMSA